MSDASFLAIDLGAESGRAVLGRVRGQQLTTEEVHRFANGGVRLASGLYWDALGLFREIVTGISLAVKEGPVLSLGVDSWGVDYGLLGQAGDLLANPRHYRDPRTQGLVEAACETFSREQIFAWTGVQFQPFNTLYQLLAERDRRPWLLSGARRLLMMGELMTYLLTGEEVAEFTNATTTQLYDPRRQAWSRELFSGYELPLEIMPAVVPPGTQVGPLTGPAQDEVGEAVPVVVPAVHDTASAVAAVPAAGDDWCYISSGTWSLVGVECEQPVMTPMALAYNFTNEGGVAGTFRLLRNIMGLWLLQESRRHWRRQGTRLSFDELTAAARDAAPLRSIIDPDDARFFAPGDIPARIRTFCRQTGQPEPSGVGSVARCILESLALAYGEAVEQLETLTHKRIGSIHVVGGGARNALLNRMTAAASRRAVITGPVEATAVGNLLVQATAAGVVPDLATGRAMVRRSFPVARVKAEANAAWDGARQRFADIKGGDWD